MTKPSCDIHGEELVCTVPADPENGPSEHDCENELICFDCESEIEQAAIESLCLPHHLSMLDCLPCLYADN